MADYRGNTTKRHNTKQGIRRVFRCAVVPVLPGTTPSIQYVPLDNSECHKGDPAVGYASHFAHVACDCTIP